MAASLARNAAASGRVCVVDADPIALDVTTRLGVRAPLLEDYAGVNRPTIAQLGRLYSPALEVLPCGGSAVGRLHLAAEKAVPELREAFDVVVADLPGGPSGPGSVFGSNLDLLDWLVLAVTPTPDAVAAAHHFLELFDEGRRRGATAVRLAVVCTGDESTTDLGTDEVARRLGVDVSARVPQLWGRAEPNFGFGPALAIPELDDAVYDLFTELGLGTEYRPSFVTA
jgi:MinD-like ATPase involved in chromosome partitioning or flagellar assembly